MTNVLSFSKESEQILIGSILGDGCIYLNGRWLRYTESHCIQQKEYD